MLTHAGLTYLSYLQTHWTTYLMQGCDVRIRQRGKGVMLFLRPIEEYALG
jgi:hypothetical protein